MGNFKLKSALFVLTGNKVNGHHAPIDIDVRVNTGITTGLVEITIVGVTREALAGTLNESIDSAHDLLERVTSWLRAAGGDTDVKADLLDTMEIAQVLRQVATPV